MLNLEGNIIKCYAIFFKLSKHQNTSDTTRPNIKHLHIYCIGSLCPALPVYLKHKTSPGG